MVRRVLVGLLSSLLLVLAAGCSSGAGSTVGSDPATPSSKSSGEGAFPVSVQTSYGAVSIDRQPARIVVLNNQLVETAVAVGVTLVGGPKATTPLGPWVDGKIDQSDTGIYSLPMDDGIPVEQVAAFRPDLIIGSDYQIDKPTYAKLSNIASTIVLPLNTANDSQQPTWESSALTIGAATGHRERAREVVDAVLAKIARVKADNPQIDGKTFQLGNFLSDSQFVCTNSDQTSSALFLRSLGLKLAKLPGAGSAPRVVLSKERFTDLNDVDLVIMGSSDPQLAAALTKDPIFSQLEPVKKKTADQVDLTWVTAYNIPTVLSIPSLLDQLSPYLKRL